MATSADELREQVRRRYAEAATAASTGGCGCEEDGGCCGNAACDGEDGAFGEALYDAEQRGELPEAATLASLGAATPPLSRSSTRATPCSTSVPVAEST